MFKRNVANIVTALGVALCFIYLWFVIFHREMITSLFWLAFSILATDFVDGVVARNLRIVSNFGKMADTFRDKFFEGITFFFFLSDLRIDVAIKLIIVPIALVETALIVIRFVGLRNRIALASNKYGKWKMTGIFLTCLLCMIHVKYRSLAGEWDAVAVFLLFVLFGASLGLGVRSFTGQIKNYRRKMRQKHREIGRPKRDATIYARG